MRRGPPISSDAPPRRLIIFAVLALTLAGLLLRLAAARGDLWLDEIWSLQNLEKLHGVGGIFLGISEDNNHYLNSLWLWLVGPNAPPLLIRLEAVICGTLTIPVAAVLCGRAGAAAGLAGAALTAGAALFVHYGSEARGYAGLILMIFIAAEALERFLETFATGKTGMSRLAFGGAVALGALFHLTMLPAAVALVIATLLRLYLRGTPFLRSLSAAIDLAIPAILGAVPALVCLILGAMNVHKFQLGLQVPFSIERLVQGLATLDAATLGLPYDWPSWTLVFVTAVLVLTACVVIRKDQRVLPLAVLLLPPIIGALVHMPNVHIARFYLVSALGFVLLVAAVFALLWQKRRFGLAILLVLELAIGNGFNLAPLLTRGRGDYQSVIKRMEAEGQATYTSNMEAEVNRIVRFYDMRLDGNPGGHLVQANSADWCSAPPDWFILSDDPAGEAPRRAFGRGPCGAVYALKMTMQPAPLSGLRWALYRRSH